MAQPQKQKTPDDVRGFKVKCVNFVKCPMCYGCRNYRSIDLDCAKCMENKKINVCNTNLHKSDLIAKMIMKDKIKLPDDVQFKSNR
jgi:hypothetical protein